MTGSTRDRVVLASGNSGKLAELTSRLRLAEAELLIVNHELGAGQQRNLDPAAAGQAQIEKGRALSIAQDARPGISGHLAGVAGDVGLDAA